MKFPNENIRKNKSCCEQTYTTELSQANKLCMCKIKHTICDIVDKSSKSIITETKVLENCNGSTILIKGFIAIKIHYSSNNKSGLLLSECFVEPFLATINIPKCKKFEICNVTSKVNYCNIDKLNSKNFFLYTLINFCVQTKEDDCFNLNCEDYDFCEDDFETYSDNLNFRNDDLNCAHCCD